MATTQKSHRTWLFIVQ